MDNLLTYINQHYGLDLISSDKVTAGFQCENYFVSGATNKYFLKKYRYDNAKRIAEIHSSKQYFADGGIPVILPISDRNNKTFFVYKGSYYAVFPFVEGIHLERKDLTKNSIISLGKMLGRIHLLGRDAKLEIDNRFKLEDTGTVMKKIEDILIKIDEKDALDEFDILAKRNVLTKKQLILENKIAVAELGLVNDHLIHGDYLEHNVFFDENHNVKRVFDFEKTSYSPRTYELFRSMIYSIFVGDVTENELNNARVYLDAYSSIYPISNNEIKRGMQLFFLKAIHGFWVESEHYLKGNTRVDNFLFDDLGRIDFLSKSTDKLIDTLTK